MEFRLPDAGEGLTEAEIVTWRVAAGDSVEVNDPLVEIETAKSLVELPSPVAGMIAEILVAAGELVPVGTPIIRITEAGAAPSAASAAAPVTPQPAMPSMEPALTVAPVPAQPMSADEPMPAQPTRQPVLVGYGPRIGAVQSRRRPLVADPAAGGEAAATPLGNQPLSGSPGSDSVTLPSPVADHPARSLAEVRPLAKPPVRKLARDLRVDLRLVHPSGPGGTITRDDVKAAAVPERPVPAAVPGPVVPTEPADRTGPTARTIAGRAETRTPIRGVRRVTAQAMVASAFTAPHVTVWVTVDITRTMKLVRRTGSSPLVLIVRALLLAVRRNPGVNARWDDGASEIVTPSYVDVGIAAATPRGLLVPVVRDAQDLSPEDLQAEISRLVKASRDGTATPADLRGGTITVTNIGVFGVDGGTPILPPGQSAILAVGQIAERPWVHKGKVVPREILELTLSFDHRLIDGDLGSRFLADVAAVLEHPSQGLLWS